MIWKHIAVKLSNIPVLGEDVAQAREQATPLLSKPIEALEDEDLIQLVALDRKVYGFDNLNPDFNVGHLRLIEKELAKLKPAPLCSGEDFV